MGSMNVEMGRGTRTDGWDPRDDKSSLSPIQRRRYEEWKRNMLRKEARDKNRENCTEEKRETCDQITGNLCTGDCPTGDV